MRAKDLRGALSAIVSADDPPETKLRKLYARAKQVRNVSFEHKKALQELGRLKRDRYIVAPKETLKRGYGIQLEITGLFVGLARAAGFETSVLSVATRDNNFFDPSLLAGDQLTGDVVAVRLGNEERFFDPGTPYTPFDLLPWEKIGVKGIRLSTKGDVFVRTPNPVSTDARTERKAVLRLAPDGTLEGKGHVAFHGQEALRRRLRAFEKDDLARRERLEEELKGWLPAEATVEIDSIKHWENPEEPLRVEFSVRASDLATVAGRRLLLPLGVFQTNEKNRFQHANRVHPVYFPHPWEEHDEIILRVPAGYEVEGMPEPRRSSAPFGQYEMSCEKHPKACCCGGGWW